MVRIECGQLHSLIGQFLFSAKHTTVKGCVSHPAIGGKGGGEQQAEHNLTSQ